LNLFRNLEKQNKATEPISPAAACSHSNSSGTALLPCAAARPKAIPGRRCMRPKLRAASWHGTPARARARRRRCAGGAAALDSGRRRSGGGLRRGGTAPHGAREGRGWASPSAREGVDGEARGHGRRRGATGRRRQRWTTESSMALHIGTGGKGMLGFSLLPWQRSTQAAAFELDLTSGRSWRLRPEEDAAE
jgi:hypothetical protein